MNYPLTSSSLPPRAQSARTIALRRVALPTEHGGWGFLGEPLLAGLAIAYSPTALWITLMTIGAFLLRQPLRVYFMNLRSRRSPDLASTAMGFAACYFVIFATGITGMIATGGPLPLIPFFAVLPMIGVQAYFEIFRRSRDLVPEIFGAISISSSVAAIALCKVPWPFALALWLVMIGRLVPSILYIRSRLLLEKGKRYSVLQPVTAHLVAFTLVLILVGLKIVPMMTLLAMMLLLYRAITGLSSGRKKLTATQIGVREVVYGIVTVLILVIGYHAGI